MNLQTGAMGLLLLSTTLRWTKSEVDEMVRGTDADYSCRIRYERMYPENRKSKPCIVHVDKLKVCRGNTPAS